MSSLYDIIKRISVEANEAEKNDRIFTGKVISCNEPYIDPYSGFIVDIIENPFKVQLSDKIIMTYGDSFLLATGTMAKEITNKDITRPLYFEVGDKVLLLRINKGKNYLLIDKAG